MSEIFADSFYFIALQNPADRFHLEAVRFAATLTRPIVTTAWVFVEVADALSTPRLRRHIRHALEGIKAHPGTHFIAADADWYARGLQLYGARPDNAWSLTDCISFEVMTELRLVEALTGDHHFEQAGFRPLFGQP